MMHIQLLQCPIPNHLAFLGPGFPPSLLQKGGHGRWPIPYNRGMAGLGRSRRRIIICCGGMGFLGLVDPWAPTVGIESQSIASQLFAFSLFPYIGFLYFITKSNSAPKLTLFGFYFLLAFVGATIQAVFIFLFEIQAWLQPHRNKTGSIDDSGSSDKDVVGGFTYLDPQFSLQQIGF
ncbi:uncharacterized protein LOC127787072 isoform X4 [Diospyros lotus]|uniref:uncharacterized protein LOC127787072 isoform X4 n=1 Tax=Diospyros lotus TaxID=55363 RepID=UPI002254F80F|nr:uncharacterized protein LOC127787072 isoform X4 [Diospyros lotus]